MDFRQQQQPPRGQQHQQVPPINPMEWFLSIPLLTRIWFGAAVAITTGVTMDMIPAQQVLYDWDKIWYDLELWRIATSFCFAGGQLREFSTLILLYLIYIIVRQYEDRPLNCGAGGTKADAAFALVFCCLITCASFPLVKHYLPFKYHIMPCFTRNLAYSIMYLWSRKNPNARADINFIPIQGMYVPFAHLGISLCMGHRINEMVHGILVGHVFYYLAVVVPTITGRRWFATPDILVELLRPTDDRRIQIMQEQMQEQEQFVDQVPQPQNNMANDNDNNDNPPPNNNNNNNIPPQHPQQ